MRQSQLVFTVGVAAGFALIAPPEQAPQAVPIIDLPPAIAQTAATLGGVLGLHETSGGKVLVNDGGRRQVLLYDTTLATSRVVVDSVDGTPDSYGPVRIPMTLYLGDSSIMVDITAGMGSLLVLDANGRVVRALALPNAMDAGSFASYAGGVDPKGRLVYRVGNFIRMPKPGTVGAQEVFTDSVPIVRADLDARRVDTIGKIGMNKGEYTRIDHTEAKKIVRTVIVNPLPSPDEWAMISDGSVAIVRGHDYHIDWVRPDGTRSSTPKLPFDWKRLTDEDKQKLIDSTLSAHAEQNALAARTRNAPPPPPVENDGTGGRTRTGDGAGITRAAYDGAGNLWVPLNYEVVPVKDVPDYYPAIRAGAVMADVENHLWILPTTSAQSRQGELVYDVVNTRGELFERVRLPVGRLIAGFGKGGVVYMLAGDKKNGFHLERTRLPAAAR